MVNSNVYQIIKNRSHARLCAFFLGIFLSILFFPVFSSATIAQSLVEDITDKNHYILRTYNKVCGLLPDFACNFMQGKIGLYIVGTDGSFINSDTYNINNGVVPFSVPYHIWQQSGYSWNNASEATGQTPYKVSNANFNPSTFYCHSYNISTVENEEDFWGGWGYFGFLPTDGEPVSYLLYDGAEGWDKSRIVYSGFVRKDYILREGYELSRTVTVSNACRFNYDLMTFATDDNIQYFNAPPESFFNNKDIRGALASAYDILKDTTSELPIADRDILNNEIENSLDYLDNGVVYPSTVGVTSSVTNIFESLGTVDIPPVQNISVDVDMTGVESRLDDISDDTSDMRSNVQIISDFIVGNDTTSLEGTDFENFIDTDSLFIEVSSTVENSPFFASVRQKFGGLLDCSGVSTQTVIPCFDIPDVLGATPLDEKMCFDNYQPFQSVYSAVYFFLHLFAFWVAFKIYIFALASAGGSI